MELNTNTNLENDILIVDDSDDTLELLSALLTIAGYIVSTANNGTKALQIVKEKKFSLILLDIMLPDIDGYEVCKKLKEDESSKYEFFNLQVQIEVLYLTMQLQFCHISPLTAVVICYFLSKI